MEYNTDRGPLILKEYGRNVQNLIRYTSEFEDKEKRTEAAETLVYLMKQLNSTLKDNNESQQRVWDHLYLMADLKLDVDSPYEPPEKAITKKPLALSYKEERLRYKHYGRNVVLLIQHAASIEDREKQLDAVSYVGRLMMGFYTAWNKDNINEVAIVKHIKELSENRIEITLEEVLEKKLFEGGNFGRKKMSHSSSSSRKSSHKRGDSRHKKDKDYKKRGKR